MNVLAVIGIFVLLLMAIRRLPAVILLLVVLWLFSTYSPGCTTNSTVPTTASVELSYYDQLRGYLEGDLSIRSSTVDMMLIRYKEIWTQGRDEGKSVDYIGDELLIAIGKEDGSSFGPDADWAGWKPKPAVVEVARQPEIVPEEIQEPVQFRPVEDEGQFIPDTRPMSQEDEDRVFDQIRREKWESDREWFEMQGIYREEPK